MLSGAQIDVLRGRQQSKRFHPFTCPYRNDERHRKDGKRLGVLVPTADRWTCPDCDYTQSYSWEIPK